MNKCVQLAANASFAVLLIGCGSADDGGTIVPVVPPVTTPSLATLGDGILRTRYTSEISVGTRYAYSSTWGTRNGIPGNAVFIWDLAAATPVIVDSIIVANAGTTGDVQVIPDANLLVVAVEPTPRGAIVMYDVSDPIRPQLIGRYETPNTQNGVHTAQVSRVDGRLYAFLCIDPVGSAPARLVIVDITNPRAPTELFVQALGAPFVHDVFVRDGILLTAEWNNGIGVYDIGGGGRGGTPRAPVSMGRGLTAGGSAHNVYWLRDSVSGSRYAFVGEEKPGAIGTSSRGDIHVLDVSDWANIREVAFFTVTGAGTHNFFVDESAGVLYAAYYNAGVRALDVRGDLGSCETTAKDTAGRCNLALMGRVSADALANAGRYIWGVDGASNGIIASDMLGGIVRLARAPRTTR
jgi:hypothetical protein